MTGSTAVPPAMETIQKLSSAVFPSFAMLAGCQLDVFTPLKDGALDADQLAEALGLGVAKLRPLLYALVSVGLLTVTDGRFENTVETNHYLVRGSPAYMGSRHELWSLAWDIQLKTADSIRGGRGQGRDHFDYANTPPEQLERVFRGLHAGAVAHGRMLAQRYDFSAYQTLIDVAGGSGGLAVALTQTLPHLSATVVDLPSVTPITQRFVAETDTAERIQVVTADVIRGSLTGLYDVAVLRAFIQILSADEARLALQNVGRVVKPGGAIFILGWVLDDSRLSPPEAVTTNLFLLNAYDDGQAYTESEHREWLSEAGFEDFGRVILPEALSIISARKRS